MFQKAIAAVMLALLIPNSGLAQSSNASKADASTPQAATPGDTQATTKKFDMFGINAQQFYSGEILVGNKKCKLKGSGDEKCIHFAGPSIADVETMKFGTFFNNGKVYILTGASAGTNFRRVAEAFEAKYGKPYKAEDEEWKNRAGATFNNVKMTWAFDEGVLILESRGSRIDEMRFMFVSDGNSPKAAAPSVNF